MRTSDIIYSFSGAFLFTYTFMALLETIEYESKDIQVLGVISFLLVFLYLVISISRDRKQEKEY